MSDTTRDPQTKMAGAAKTGGLAAVAFAVVAAFFPDVDAAKAVAGLGMIQALLNLAGSAARDWLYDTGETRAEAGPFIWLASRLG